MKQPKYLQIAVDIANKIIGQEYQIGEKIYARSAIASQYHVSAETARRAICILTDLQIVETTKGSGVKILDSEKARLFVQQYADIETVDALQREILENIANQTKEAALLQGNLQKLIDYTARFRSLNPFIPFEMRVKKDSHIISKTVAELNFWSNTQATIIAIKRDTELFISPGPYAQFKENDIIFFIGDEEVQNRVERFMYDL